MREELEEIMEAVWRAEEDQQYTPELIRRQCAIDIAEEDFSELEREGFIMKTGGKVLFSEKGKALAGRVVRRHRLAEVLLNSILKLKDARAEEIACKVEHTLLPEVEEAICTLLGHPRLCPDGKPIPRGTCCENGTTTVDHVVVRLTELKPGESGKVSYLRPSDHGQLHQLLSFGLSPGTLVTVHRKVPALCIKFENMELALDDEIAQNIYVLRSNAR